MLQTVKIFTIFTIIWNIYSTHLRDDSDCKIKGNQVNMISLLKKRIFRHKFIIIVLLSMVLLLNTKIYAYNHHWSLFLMCVLGCLSLRAWGNRRGEKNLIFLVTFEIVHLHCWMLRYCLFALFSVFQDFIFSEMNFELYMLIKTFFEPTCVEKYIS